MAESGPHVLCFVSRIHPELESLGLRALRDTRHRFLSGSILGPQQGLSDLFRDCIRYHRDRSMPAEILIEPRSPSALH
ncbi:MAG: hypothetical protein EA417_23115 [Gammaproteobacteria bacterium]|nr:MAG: hypothetical protein EA417_23115 [Gammaproteobacteria bacterium]